MRTPHFPLEPDPAQRDAWLKAIASFIHDHIDGLPTAAACGPLGEAGSRLASRLSVEIGEQPLPGGMERIIEILRDAVGASLNTASPGYLAYIPGGGIYTAALADFASNCFNRYTGVAAAAPALSRLENDVLHWIAREFGYGDAARGILTSGGSLANFSAMVAAREHYFRETDDLRLGVVYTSAQVHHSVAKCLRLAGLPRSNLRQIPVDTEFRMRPDLLHQSIETDKAAGKRPFAVVATAGTTNTGAVDPLPQIADVCQSHDLWLHVDGAYGGAFVFCEPGRRRLPGIDRADSITFDPHKGLFLPYGTGCLLVRDGARLKAAHHDGAEYLQDLCEAHTPPSAADLGPELSRDYRGLRLWLPLMLHGAAPFRAALTEKLNLAQQCATLLRQRPPIEMVAEPQLSLLAFRLRRHNGETLDTWNQRNRALLDAINARANVHISSTQLPVAHGLALTLRVCVLSFRTHEDAIGEFLRDIDACAALVI